MKRPNNKKNKTMKTAVGVGIALSAIMLSVSVDNVKAADNNAIEPVTTGVVGSVEDGDSQTTGTKATGEAQQEASNTQQDDETKAIGETKKEASNTQQVAETKSTGETQQEASNTQQVAETKSTPDTKMVGDNKASVNSGENTTNNQIEDSTKALTVPLTAPDSNALESNNKVQGIYLINDYGERVLYKVTDGTDINTPAAYYKAINEALTNSEYSGVEIDKDITLDSSLGVLNYTATQKNGSKPFTFKINDGKKLIINSKKDLTAFKIDLKDDGNFIFNNLGKIVVNNSYHAIQIFGGENSVFTMTGNYKGEDTSPAYSSDDNALLNGTMLINQNNGYAIDAQQGGDANKEELLKELLI